MNRTSKKPLYKIDPNSDVRGTGDGHYYVTTTPNWPFAKKMKDHNKTYAPYHEVVMVNHLGRPLNKAKGEEVHHKDENKANNALSNLELMTHQDHARGHSFKKKFWKKSPRTKPGTKRKKMASIVAERYIKSAIPVITDKPTHSLNRVIEYKAQSHYGGPELIYVTSDHKEPLKDLTGAKTLNFRHIGALINLGFEFKKIS